MEFTCCLLRFATPTLQSASHRYRHAGCPRVCHIPRGSMRRDKFAVASVLEIPWSVGSKESRPKAGKQRELRYFVWPVRFLVGTPPIPNNEPVTMRILEHEGPFVMLVKLRARLSTAPCSWEREIGAIAGAFEIMSLPKFTPQLFDPFDILPESFGPACCGTLSARKIRWTTFNDDESIVRKNGR